MTQKTVVSGVRATGDLHLGNYLGALRQWVQFVEDAENADAKFLFFVADLHAITTPYESSQLADNTRQITASYIACGLDIDKVTLFAQSSVPEHTYLQWLFTSVTPMGWLNRMTQFKEKAGKKRDNASLGLYSYPVLQAADVLLYKATHVPVGDDQKQHIELAREIAGAFNHRHQDAFFPLPEPVILTEGARVMSLRDGTEKMSKSAVSDMTRINMTDDADTIAQKIKKARTDPQPVPDSLEDMESRPEAKNLITIHAALSDMTKEAVIAEHGGKQFSEYKKVLADVAIARLGPITTRMNTLMNDKGEIDRILANGAMRAREIATPVLEDACHHMGFWRKTL